VQAEAEYFEEMQAVESRNFKMVADDDAPTPLGRPL
jgi:hypothetical protein